MNGVSKSDYKFACKSSREMAFKLRVETNAAERAHLESELRRMSQWINKYEGKF